MLATGFVAAFLLAGPQALERMDLRVSAECHHEEAGGMFRLEQSSLLSPIERRWTVVATQPEEPGSHSGCLKTGARLTIIADKSLDSQFQAGESFKAKLRLKSPRASLQLDGFDPEGYWMAQGISGSASLLGIPEKQESAGSVNFLDYMNRARLAVSDWLNYTLAEHPQAGLVIALVTGDQGLISPAERDVFNETGIAHLVAISGLHITLLANLSSAFLGWLWRRNDHLSALIPSQFVGPVFGLLLAGIYSVLSGWGIPAQRTLAMQLVSSLFTLQGLCTSSWNVWALAMAVVIVSNPWAVVDVGFLLSFGALGVLILATNNQKSFVSWKNTLIWQSCRAQFAATVGLMPLTVWLFNQQSLVSPIANALSIPWMSFVITPLAIGGALLRQDWAIWLAASGLDLQATWLGVLAEPTWAAWPVAQAGTAVLILSQIGACLQLVPCGMLPRMAGCLLLGLLFLPASRPGFGEFWVDAHDVGQGTAVTIRTAKHTLLYDTGAAFSERSDSARRVIKPFMLANGINQLDALWISHDDADHTGGAKFILEKVKVIETVSSLGPDHPLKQIAKSKSEAWKDCTEEQPWEWDGILFEPLPIDFPKGHTPKDNDLSCVLRVSNEAHSMLLTGDIESEAEKLLVDQHQGKLNSDVLFAPHHGSKTSSSQILLDAVNPTMVWIQSGWKNRFGHPHIEVSSRFKSRAVTIFDTAQNGALHGRFGHLESSSQVISSRGKRARYWHLHETSAFSP